MQLAKDIELRYLPILRDWQGNVYRDRLVLHLGKVWFVKYFKPSELGVRYARLAYLLGKDWLNIAEVQEINSAEMKALRNTGIPVPAKSTATSTALIRFVPDLTPDELPIGNSDQALAYEIVFSLWVRRRDAHSFNRVFHHGVPIFFDHQTAFLLEPELRDIDNFFSTGSDPGRPGLWRLPPTAYEGQQTEELRNAEREAFSNKNIPGFAYLPIRDYDLFRESCHKAAEVICELPDAFIQDALLHSGFAPYERCQIQHFLLQSRAKLDTLLKRLWSVLEQESMKRAG